MMHRLICSTQVKDHLYAVTTDWCYRNNVVDEGQVQITDVPSVGFFHVSERLRRIVRVMQIIVLDTQRESLRVARRDTSWVEHRCICACVNASMHASFVGTFVPLDCCEVTWPCLLSAEPPLARAFASFAASAAFVTEHILTSLAVHSCLLGCCHDIRLPFFLSIAYFLSKNKVI